MDISVWRITYLTGNFCSALFTLDAFRTDLKKKKTAFSAPLKSDGIKQCRETKHDLASAGNQSGMQRRYDLTQATEKNDTDSSTYPAIVNALCLFVIKRA